MKCKDEATLRLWIAWIKQAGVPTGSRVIGGYTDGSDEDYVICQSSVKKRATELGLSYDCRDVDMEDYGLDFMSRKYRLSESDHWVNLIIVPTALEMCAWKDATLSVRGLPKNIRNNRSRRHIAFHWAYNDYMREAGYADRANRCEGILGELIGG